MKLISTIITIMLIATLSACDGHDMPVQHADNHEYISFSAQPQKTATRANPYEAYDPLRHPATIGTFGYYDMPKRYASAANTIFSNETATYNASTSSWDTATKKRWAEYPKASSFDFFAYMPYTDGATLLRNANNTYTLSFPFAMSDGGDPVPVIYDTKAAPIICAVPGSKGAISDSNGGGTVSLKFDQTLTGYRLLFMLGTKMNAIRHFRIKSVTLSGSFSTSCTISRSYVWNTASKSWSASAITWSDIKRQSFVETPFPIAYKSYGTADYDDNTRTAIVTSADYTQWGADFYTIPDAEFLPVITVKYDVEFIAEDGTTIITRKNVTSGITINKDNFSSLTTGKTATISPIRILIQPRYLYVLADEDAYTGHLLID